MSADIQLLVATLNAGKMRELKEMLSDLHVGVVSLADFPDIEPIEETGKTFIENAKLKAAGYAAQAQRMTLADDSGLEVDALGGSPGVFSARHLGQAASYAERMASLLKELTAIDGPSRTARFVSAIAIANADSRVLNTSIGSCEGHISLEPRGSAGFGYDPIFIPQGYDLTFAELDAEVKNQISHRAQALRGARKYLRSLTSLLYAD